MTTESPQPQGTIMNASLRTLTLACALIALPFVARGQSVAAVGSALATTPVASCAPVPMSAFQQHVVAKAASGVDALRDYLFITRGIYNVSMEDTVAWLDRQRETQHSCVAVAQKAARP
jgi:hypothetical protein